MRPAEITAVRTLFDHWLRLWFADGAIVDVDVWPLISEGQVFEALRADRAVFEQVHVDGGTIAWPGDVDFCPDVLYGHYEPECGTKFGRRVIRAGSGSVA
jgi:Protein of unknown function (DUF2442)